MKLTGAKLTRWLYGVIFFGVLGIVAAVFELGREVNSSHSPIETNKQAKEEHLSAEQPATQQEPVLAGEQQASDKSETEQVSWEFLAKLNLNESLKGDYDDMVKRRAIRALVVYNKTNYFLDGARERGITYDALKEFENVINKNLKNSTLKIHVIFIPVTRDQLFSGLVEGRGDIAAASLTVTPERLKKVDFSVPAMEGVRELVVTGPGAPQLNSLEDLAGKEVYVRASSSYNESLRDLNESFHKKDLPPIKIVPVDEYLEDEDILEMTNAGLMPITVIDDFVGSLWSKVFPDIRVRPNLSVHNGGSIAWAFRKDTPRLEKIVNDYIKNHKKGTLFGNFLAKKYFQNVEYIKNNTTTEEMKKFKATVQFFKKYADRYSFDYLMVAAQAYQESRLDQSLRSRSGAIGVMQIKPSTAADKNVNVPDITKLDNNIHAGVKYMRFMMDQYFKNEPMDRLNKGLFAVASYNVGPNGIARLRKKAKEIGLNPNIWFDNVEIIAAEEIGREPVQYVSNIFKYYIAYKQIEAQSALRLKKTTS